MGYSAAAWSLCRRVGTISRLGSSSCGGVRRRVPRVSLHVAVMVARMARGRHAPSSLPVPGPEPRAFGILAERFAKGEIDAETFRSMKAELGRDD